MKKIILGLFFIGLGIQSYGQDVIFKEKIKKEEMPAAIIEEIATDFGDLEVVEFYALPIEFIEEEVYVNEDFDNNEDYDTYQVILKGKQGRINATFNKKGQLLSTVEHLKNVAPNIAVRRSIADNFSGWTITKDHYKMTHFSNEQKKERYKINLVKGDSKMVVYMDGKGEILKFNSIK